jgi:uncharacterized protein
MNWVLVGVIGLMAGVVSGLFGVAGAVVIIPGLLFVGLPQHTANGTSLAALLLPAGILIGTLEYYKRGQVHVPYAALLAVGLFVGALVGAKLAGTFDEVALRRGFAVFLMLVAVRLLLR